MCTCLCNCFFFFSSRRRHTRFDCDWSSDVWSSDLDVTFDWILGREYVQMHEVSRERAANGTPAYEAVVLFGRDPRSGERSEEHTSELQSQSNLVCRLLLEKKKKSNKHT